MNENNGLLKEDYLYIKDIKLEMENYSLRSKTSSMAVFFLLYYKRNYKLRFSIL